MPHFASPSSEDRGPLRSPTLLSSPPRYPPSSQLDVRRLSDGEALIRGASGGSVNNALALAPAAGPGGTTLLFASNNDCTVRVFSLPPPRGAAGGGGCEGDFPNFPTTSGRVGGGWQREPEEEDEDACAPEAAGGGAAWGATTAAPAGSGDENDGGAANDAMEEDGRLAEYEDDEDDPTGGWGAAASPRDRGAHSRRGRGGGHPHTSTTRPRRRPSTAEASRAARARAGAPLAIVRCLDPVNYCAVGPSATAASGLLLASVGDCPVVTLHSPTEAGYTALTTWDVFDDAGMACAWAPGGGLLAAAGQDGTVVALDPRSRTPTARVRTRGAARALKFAPGPSDLLAVTEHDSAVHILDARTWGSAQVVRFGGADGGPRHVSGAAFSPGTGGKLYVGLEGAGIAQFSVDVAGRCCVAEWGAR